MVLIRKNKAGADTFGHEWLEDGAVVDVDAVEALELLAIKDAGFSVVEPEPEPEEPYVVNPDDGPQTGARDLDVLKASAQGAKAENADLTVVADAVTSVLQDDREDEKPEDLTEGPAEPEQPVAEAPAPAKPRSARASRKN